MGGLLGNPVAYGAFGGQDGCVGVVVMYCGGWVGLGWIGCVGGVCF